MIKELIESRPEAPHRVKVLLSEAKSTSDCRRSDCGVSWRCSELALPLSCAAKKLVRAGAAGMEGDLHVIQIVCISPRFISCSRSHHCRSNISATVDCALRVFSRAAARWTAWVLEHIRHRGGRHRRRRQAGPGDWPRTR